MINYTIDSFKIVKMRKITSLLVFICILWFAPENVFSQSVYAFSLNNLNFGDVFIGYPAEIKHKDNNAAKFVFLHTQWFRKKDFLVTLTLPQYLSRGNDKIPIKFRKRHAAWSFQDRPYGRKRFNPHAPLYIKNVGFFRPVYIWLGGKIKTTAGNIPGIHNGTITLTVEIL